MGVLTMEIEKVNKTIIENQKEVEKLTRQLNNAKEEEKTQKEYERDLKKAIEHDCIECMKRDFEKAKSQIEQLRLQQEEEARKNTTAYKVLATLGVIGLIVLLILKWAVILGIGACIFIFALICMCAKGK